MLLSHPTRRPGQDPESGTVMAMAVAVLAVTGIVAATLLAAAMYATGFTSASRAGVQAQAAAEAGIDYAEANPAACSNGIILSPAGTTPRFRITVEHRVVGQTAWTSGCPSAAGNLEAQLVSTGWAQTPGVAGHSRGNTRSMVAILRSQFPRAVVGDRGIRSAGNLDVTLAGSPAMSTNGDFVCNGGVLHTGTLYVHGTATPSGCGRTGPLVAGAAVDPTAPQHEFPRLYKGDPRFPTTTRTLAWLATAVGSTGTTGTDPCSIVASPTGQVLSAEPVLVDATSCAGPNGLSLSINGTLSLRADVVILVSKLTTPSGRLLRLQSGDGRQHALYLVKPWPLDRVGGCPDIPGADFQTADLQLFGSIQSVDRLAAVMLYSSTGIVTGPNSGNNPVNGQIYGCKVNLQGASDLRFVPLGPLRLVSKRDVPVPR